MRHSNRALLALPLMLAAVPASAQSAATDYIDDRSSAERVIVSFYNAIGRQEFLRAWAYFDPQTAPPLDGFRQGYANTVGVSLRIGTVDSEGAAGSIHLSVPVALKATEKGGKTVVYAGCYRLTQVQAANQEVPPFRPIQIDAGTLEPSDTPFETAIETCGETVQPAQ